MTRQKRYGITDKSETGMNSESFLTLQGSERARDWGKSWLYAQAFHLYRQDYFGLVLKELRGRSLP